MAAIKSWGALDMASWGAEGSGAHAPQAGSIQRPADVALGNGEGCGGLPLHMYLQLCPSLGRGGGGEQRPGMDLRRVLLLQLVISVTYYLQEEKGWEG